MLIYKSYYNIAPTYLCELISRKERSVTYILYNNNIHLQLLLVRSSYESKNNNDTSRRVYIGSASSITSKYEVIT